jgi:tRNA C32,U32 (ribose-2'-O)-methylase TrmJ
MTAESHVSTAKDMYATTEELLEMVSSMQSVLRLYEYNEHQWDKSVSCELWAVSQQLVKLGISTHS